MHVQRRRGISVIARGGVTARDTAHVREPVTVELAAKGAILDASTLDGEDGAMQVQSLHLERRK